MMKTSEAHASYSLPHQRQRFYMEVGFLNLL